MPGRPSKWQAMSPAKKRRITMATDPISAQRYLEDLTPGGSEYHNNPKRCFEWAQGRIESAHRIAMEAALERNRLREDNGRLLGQVSRLEAEIERLRAALIEIIRVIDHEQPLGNGHRMREVAWAALEG
jgi:hypothetical protein